MHSGPFPQAGGLGCTRGRSWLLLVLMGCAEERGCPSTITHPSPSATAQWIHAPPGAPPRVTKWVSGGTAGGIAAPLLRGELLKGRGCLRSSDTAPTALMGMNGGTVLVLGEVININYPNQPLPAHPRLHNVSEQGEMEAESMYSLSRSLPLRTSLSKESCNQTSSSRAQSPSHRCD